MNKQQTENILSNIKLSDSLTKIAEKVLNGNRITEQEGIVLFEEGELGFLGTLADYVREKKNGNNTYYIRNFHIEPTNICVYDCRFCSYRKDNAGSWKLSTEEIIEKVKVYTDKDVKEVHITGGAHPDSDLYYYGTIIKEIKKILPNVHIKAFSAVELNYVISKAHLSYKEGLSMLKECGLNSIPGGGAEIFDEKLREEICNKKVSSSEWLEIHEAAHRLGIPSNATMLYGHIETYAHRINHIERLRTLQDKTGMFNSFIPLKFKNKNNEMSHIREVHVIEDLKNYTVSRIFLDNFHHIKAYWPMLGKSTTQLSLSFGVDDVDGTINDSTSIYSSAGAEDISPSMTSDELIELIKQVNRIPVERDSLYNTMENKQC